MPVAVLERETSDILMRRQLNKDWNEMREPGMGISSAKSWRHDHAYGV